MDVGGPAFVCNRNVSFIFSGSVAGDFCKHFNYRAFHRTSKKNTTRQLGCRSAHRGHPLLQSKTFGALPWGGSIERKPSSLVVGRRRHTERIPNFWRRLDWFSGRIQKLPPRSRSGSTKLSS